MEDIPLHRGVTVAKVQIQPTGKKQLVKPEQLVVLSPGDSAEYVQDEFGRFMIGGITAMEVDHAGAAAIGMGRVKMNIAGKATRPGDSVQKFKLVARHQRGDLPVIGEQAADGAAAGIGQGLANVQ